MSGIEDYFGAAGDMFSGSQDPDEQNRAQERKAEKRRREQEKEQARLLREQQAEQAERQPSLYQTTPKPIAIEKNEPTFIPTIDPNDPLSAIPEEKRTDILLHKYDHRQPTDYLGQPLTPDKRDEYVNTWKKRVAEAAPGVRDSLLQIDMNRDPAIKKQIEQAARELRQWLSAPKVRTTEFRSGDKGPRKLSRTAPYRPKRDRVAPVQNAFQSRDDPGHNVKTNTVLEQTAHVYDPADQSMGPLFDFMNEHSIAPMDGNEAWAKNSAGHLDESYGEAEKKIGRTAVKYVNKGLAPGSPVYGKDGNRTVGEPDQTTGSLVPAVFRNLDHGAVAKAQEDINRAQGFTYHSKYGSREAFAFEKGMKMVPLEAKTAFYSFASLMGETLYSVTGGDPTALRNVQQTLKAYQKQMDAMKPMTIDQIIVPNDPEKTMQNVTDYFYQNLGNQLVKVPVTVLLGKADSIASITGMSVATVTAKLHGELQNKTGKAHLGESILYGVPLGLLSLLNVPFKAPVSVKSPKEVKDWVVSVLADFGVSQGQEAGTNYVVKQRTDRKSDDKDTPQ